MKIITKRADYYDNIAYMYGGGDPKVVYRRIEAPEDIIVPPHLNIPLNPFEPRTRGKDRPKPKERPPQYRWLAFCGRYYPVQVRYRKEEEDIDMEFKWVEEYSADWSSFSIDRHSRHFIANQGEHNNELVELAKIIGHPVFMIDCSRNLNVFGRARIMDHLPHLGDMHFGRIMAPEQAYQQIAYFVGNMMNDSPDVNPPAEVEDKDRIVQHGFDLKQSFRHRRNYE